MKFVATIVVQNIVFKFIEPLRSICGAIGSFDVLKGEINLLLYIIFCSIIIRKSI